MQCMGNSGSIPRAGKASSNFFFFLCAPFQLNVSTGCEAHSFTTDMGSLPCTQIWVRAVHTKGVQTQANLKGGGPEKLFHPAPQGYRTPGLQI